MNSGTVLLLIRHAHTDAVGRSLAGRAPVPLNDVGRAQADRLAAGLARVPLAAIYSSPLRRAMDTARVIATAHDLPVQMEDDLSEIDFGEWTGRTFDELASSPAWQAFNTHRATAPIPNGESAADAQARIVAVLPRLAAGHPGGTIAVVSHADVLRYAVLHYAGTSLDLYHRFEISPASVTALALGPGGPRLLYVNNHRFAADPAAVDVLPG